MAGKKRRSGGWEIFLGEGDDDWATAKDYDGGDWGSGMEGLRRDGLVGEGEKTD
jgi:hypothetical protein